MGDVETMPWLVKRMDKPYGWWFRLLNMLAYTNTTRTCTRAPMRFAFALCLRLIWTFGRRGVACSRTPSKGQTGILASTATKTATSFPSPSRRALPPLSRRAPSPTHAAPPSASHLHARAACSTLPASPPSPWRTRAPPAPCPTLAVTPYPRASHH